MSFCRTMSVSVLDDELTDRDNWINFMLSKIF